MGQTTSNRSLQEVSGQGRSRFFSHSPGKVLSGRTYFAFRHSLRYTQPASWEASMAENNSAEQKNVLVVRAPVSEDGYASIYFSSTDGRQMTEREWWNLKQIVELASQMFAKPDAKTQSVAVGA
jgi:hypothetical protein